MDDVIWPKVFTDPDFDYQKAHPDRSDDERAAIAVADGLSGWGCCYMCKPPEGFGVGMLKIGDCVDATGLDVGTAQPDVLKSLADELISRIAGRPPAGDA